MNTTECRYLTNNNYLKKEMALNIKQTNKQTWMNTAHPTNNNYPKKEVALKIKKNMG